MKKSRRSLWFVAFVLAGTVAAALYVALHPSSGSNVTISSYEEADTAYNDVVEVEDSGKRVVSVKAKKEKKKVREVPPRDILSEDIPSEH